MASPFETALEEDLAELTGHRPKGRPPVPPVLSPFERNLTEDLKALTEEKRTRLAEEAFGIDLAGRPRPTMEEVAGVSPAQILAPALPTSPEAAAALSLRTAPEPVIPPVPSHLEVLRTPPGQPGPGIAPVIPAGAPLPGRVQPVSRPPAMTAEMAFAQAPEAMVEAPSTTPDILAALAALPRVARPTLEEMTPEAKLLRSLMALPSEVFAQQGPPAPPPKITPYQAPSVFEPPETVAGRAGRAMVFGLRTGAVGQFARWLNQQIGEQLPGPPSGPVQAIDPDNAFEQLIALGTSLGTDWKLFSFGGKVGMEAMSRVLNGIGAGMTKRGVAAGLTEAEARAAAQQVLRENPVVQMLTGAAVGASALAIPGAARETSRELVTGEPLQPGKIAAAAGKEAIIGGLTFGVAAPIDSRILRATALILGFGTLPPIVQEQRMPTAHDLINAGVSIGLIELAAALMGVRSGWQARQARGEPLPELGRDVVGNVIYDRVLGIFKRKGMSENEARASADRLIQETVGVAAKPTRATTGAQPATPGEAGSLARPREGLTEPEIELDVLERRAAELHRQIAAEEAAPAPPPPPAAPPAPLPPPAPRPPALVPVPPAPTEIAPPVPPVAPGAPLPAPIERPPAPVTWGGWQETPTGPPLELWTLTEAIPGHPDGSTVGRETLEAAGFTVPEPPEIPPQVPAPTRPAPQVPVPPAGVAGAPPPSVPETAPGAELPPETPRGTLPTEGFTRVGAAEYGDLPKEGRSIYNPTGLRGRVVGSDAENFYVSRLAGSVAWVDKYPRQLIEDTQAYFTEGAAVQTPYGPATLVTPPARDDRGMVMVTVRWPAGIPAEVSDRLGASALLDAPVFQGRPEMQADWVGWRTVRPGYPSVGQWKLRQPIKGHESGEVVTALAIRDAGFRAPIPPEAPPAPPTAPKAPVAPVPPPPKPPRPGKRLLRPDQLSDFRPGIDRVERRGDRTFVVDSLGERAPVEVQSDVVIPEIETRLRAQRTQPALRNRAIQAIRQTPFLSPEGKAERLRILEEPEELPAPEAAPPVTPTVQPTPPPSGVIPVPRPTDYRLVQRLPTDPVTIQMREPTGRWTTATTVDDVPAAEEWVRAWGGTIIRRTLPPPPLTAGSRVRLKDGRDGTVESLKGGVARVKLPSGQKVNAPLRSLTPKEPEIAVPAAPPPTPTLEEGQRQGTLVPIEPATTKAISDQVSEYLKRLEQVEGTLEPEEIAEGQVLLTRVQDHLDELPAAALSQRADMRAAEEKLRLPAEQGTRPEYVGPTRPPPSPPEPPKPIDLDRLGPSMRRAEIRGAKVGQAVTFRGETWALAKSGYWTHGGETLATQALVSHFESMSRQPAPIPPVPPTEVLPSGRVQLADGRQGTVVGRSEGLAPWKGIITRVRLDDGTEVNVRTDRLTSVPAAPTLAGEEGGRAVIPPREPERPAESRGPDRRPLAEVSPEPSPRPRGGQPVEGLGGGGRAPDRGGAGRPAGETGAIQPSVGGRPPRVGVPAGGRRGARPAPSVPTNLDYRFTPDDAARIVSGGPKERVRRNLDSIRLLKEIEAAGRPATPEEQQTLAAYVGWGPFKQIFERYWDPKWADLYQEIKDTLTEDEYEAARASSLNAFYTTPGVVEAMWGAVKQFGLPGGPATRILEPAMGIGYFFGFMPDTFTGVRRVGVELDPITGRMATLLFPSTRVHVQGFETVPFPKNFFDLAVSNVPFGEFGVHDPAYRREPFLTESIHNYFFAKALDVVRPSGVVAFITSRYTLDARNSRFRQWLADRATLLGAVRLPETAFQRAAGTEVVTDILFFQKYPSGTTPTWVDSTPMQVSGVTKHVNAYFQEHPEMVLGRHVVERGMYEPEALTVKPTGDLLQQLAAALAELPEDVIRSAGIPVRDPLPAAVPEPPGAVKDGGFFLDQGAIFRKHGTEAVSADIPVAQIPKVTALLHIRDAAREVLRAQLEELPDAEWETARTHLNRLYDIFLKRHGPLSARTVHREFTGDPDFPFLLALEKSYDPDTNRAEKADLFIKRTIQPYRPPERAETPQAALLIALNETGRVDLARMAALVGQSPEGVQTALAGLIYKNPEGDWETAEEYLSGNVREKLRAAEVAASLESLYQPNVEALLRIQPTDLVPGEIEVRLGSPWLPTDTAEAFIGHLLGAQPSAFRVGHHAATATWTIEARGYQGDRVLQSAENLRVWGSENYRAVELIRDSLNGAFPTVWTKDADGKNVVDQDATLAARDQQEKVKAEFRKWVWTDEDRATALAQLYNEQFNALRLREHDGRHLELPGMAKGVLRDGDLAAHQKNAVWRILQGGNALIAHHVGSGKTYVAAAAMMELRRLGLARKPMLVVPRSRLEGTAAEFLQLYPAAHLLAIQPEDLTPQKRPELMSRIATGDWDAVTVSRESFERLPVRNATLATFIREQLQELEDAIRAEKVAEGRSRSPLIRKLEVAKKKLEQKLKDALKPEAKDVAVAFEELGVDALFVDEAQAYKNLPVRTAARNIAGINTAESNRAFDLFMKSQWLLRRNNGRGLIFLTGTPITNTIAEMYTLQRFLDLPRLRQLGLAEFDAWRGQFGEIVQSVELNVQATGYRVKSRFAKFVNLPELLTLYRTVADVQTDAMLKLPKPGLAGGRRREIVTTPHPRMRAFLDELNHRVEAIQKRVVEPTVDNMLKVSTDGRKAAIDMRLFDPTAGDVAGGKTSRAAEAIYEQWHVNRAMKGTQLVFVDFSAPATGAFSVPTDLRNKLVKLGIPKAEIAFIQDAKNVKAQEQLFQNVRRGRIRVLIGSTEKMGIGVNVQNKVVALHHLDAPWRPADLEQREGRALRPGNENAEVEVLLYLTPGSFDAYMWQTLERKARFVDQIMRGEVGVRSAEDIEGRAFTYAEYKALASGNPIVAEKVQVDADILRLGRLRAHHDTQQWQIRRDLAGLPVRLAEADKRVTAIQSDIGTRNQDRPAEFSMTIALMLRTEHRGTFTDRVEAGEQLWKMLNAARGSSAPTKLGEFAGFALMVKGFDTSDITPAVWLEGQAEYPVSTLSETGLGVIRSIEGQLLHLESKLTEAEADRAALQQKRTTLEGELDKPFPEAAKLAELEQRQEELAQQLDLTANDHQAAGQETEPDEGAEEPPEIREPESRINPDAVRGFLSEMRVEREGETRATAAMDPRLLKVLGGNLYTGDLGKIAVKEMLQNAVDSVRGLADQAQGRVTVDVTLTGDTKTIAVEDNGVGMTPEVATQELVDIGGSQKVAGASGGFGIAKVAIFANAATIDVETTAKDPAGQGATRTRLSGSSDEWLDPQQGLRVETERMAPDTPTGTRISITLADTVQTNPYETRSFLNSFLQWHRLPVSFQFRLNGEIQALPQGRVDPLKTLTIPGGTIELFATSDLVSQSVVQVEILNHGLPQFRQAFFLGVETQIPGRIVADIQSREGPEAPEYPFSPDRERLRPTTERALTDYLKDELAKDAITNERREYQRILSEAPVIPGTGGHRIVDTTEGVSRDLLEAIATSDATRRVSGHLAGIVARLRAELARVEAQPYWAPEQIQYFGLSVAGAHLGMNLNGRLIEGRDDAPNLVAFNPYSILDEVQTLAQVAGLAADEIPQQFAARAVFTVIHELAHQASGAHEQTYAGALTRAGGNLIMQAAQATAALTALVKEQNNAILRTLAADLARLRPQWGGEDRLSKVVTGLAATTGAEGPPAPLGRREGAGARPREALPAGRPGAVPSMGPGPAVPGGPPGVVQEPILPPAPYGGAEPAGPEYRAAMVQQILDDLVTAGRRELKTAPTFPAWQARMLAQWGDWTRPYLQATYDRLTAPETAPRAEPTTAGTPLRPEPEPAPPEPEPMDAGVPPVEPPPPQAETMAAPNFQPPRTPRERQELIAKAAILKRLEDVLRVPIQTGRVSRPGARGVFLVEPEVIRLRWAGNLHTGLHEIGHFLHKRGMLPEGWAARLEALGQGHEGDPEREGTAEFVRLFVMDPAGAEAAAPGLPDAFTARLNRDWPRALEALLWAKERLAEFRQAPLLARIEASTVKGTRPFLAHLRSRSFAEWAVRFYTAVVDDLEPIRLIDRIVEEAQGEPLPTDRQAYVLARMAHGWTGVAAVAVTDGVPDWNTLVPRTDVPSFVKAVEPIWKDWTRFGAYVQLRRVVDDLVGAEAPPADLTGPGRAKWDAAQRRLQEAGRRRLAAWETTPAEAQRLVEQIETPAFRQAAEDLYRWNGAILDFVAASGRYAPEFLDLLRRMHAHYVPFYSWVEEPDAMPGPPGGGNRLANLPSPIRMLRGNELPLLDPLLALVRNGFALINVAIRNDVGATLVDNIESVEGLGHLLHRVPPQMVPTRVSLEEMRGPMEEAGLDLSDADLSTMGTVFRPARGKEQAPYLVIYRNGKAEHYAVDPLLYQSLLFLTPPEANLAVKTAAFFAKMLRGGVTLSPSFAVANVVRDQVTVAATAKAVPFREWAEGVAAIIGGTEVAKQYAASGASIFGIRGDDVRSLERLIRRAAQGRFSTLRDVGDRRQGMRALWEVMADAIDAISSGQEAITERATRVGVFGRQLERPRPEDVASERPQRAIALRAGFESREASVDWRRHGGSPALRQFAMTTVFFNPWIQGEDKFARTIGGKQSRARAAWMGAILFGAGLVAYLWNKEHPSCWDQRATYEKDTNFIVCLPGGEEAVKVPGAWEWHVGFIAIPRRVFEYFDRTDPDILHNFLRTSGRGLFPGSWLPNIFVPWLENAMNWSIFPGRPLVPRGVEGREPAERDTPGTAEVARRIGKALNYPPPFVQNVIRGYFGTVGMELTRLLDPLLADPTAPPPARRLSDYPVIRRFFASGPSLQSEWIERFYRYRKQATEAKGSYDQKQKIAGWAALVATDEGRKELRRRELQGDPRLHEVERFAKARAWELTIASSFEHTASLFAQSREDFEAIRADPKLTPEQKQVESDKIKRAMVQEAKERVQGADLLRRTLSIQAAEKAAAAEKATAAGGGR